MEQTESRMGRWMKQGMLFLKWLLYSAGIGLLVGGVAAAFHLGIDWAAELRVREPWILWLLPVGGMAIVLLYRVCRMEKDQGTNLVLAAVREAEPLKLRTAPLIFLSTIVTHLVGGSAGREGAALQLGGSMARDSSSLERTKIPRRIARFFVGFSIFWGSAHFCTLFAHRGKAAFFLALSALLEFSLSRTARWAGILLLLGGALHGGTRL